MYCYNTKCKYADTGKEDAQEMPNIRPHIAFCSDECKEEYWKENNKENGQQIGSN
jgi:hypothetical protein